MENTRAKKYESHAYVLAVAQPKGFRRDSKDSVSVVQGLGETYLTLLEMVPRPNVNFGTGERISLKKGARSKIDHVKRRISYEDLTPESKSELPLVVEIIVTKHEAKFVKWYNQANPITTRLHSLQLLPGVGQALMWAILEERKKEPFKSFEDISERTKLQSAKKAVKERILEELKGDVKRWLFVRPPIRE
ncbi:MAG: DUF655 domain-containing protein [Candidatus Thorarchaeota archaeon]